MFEKILIANRGEIAVTIIRACREMGIQTVAVYSQADAQALHTQLADERICIGPAAVQDSYLNQQAILTACLLTGAQALHPGFGFLSENASFADLCQQCGITFIGPSSQAIRLMGDKAQARLMAQQAGLAVVPGSQGPVLSLAQAQEAARSMGYPVLLKAVAGGGGRGMRLVHAQADLEPAWQQARTEARIGFGDDRLYVEAFLDRPRHIEVQLLADQQGQVIHLGERDCSLQRRKQKVVEEALSPMTTPAVRQQLGQAAVALARQVGYQGAGTVEFLMPDPDTFYFMEMNTRIQVEHPVTEAITGLNLIQEQIRLAAGQPLGRDQKTICFSGHAIECRINAEDPVNGFRPSPGQVTHLQVPGGPGVRVDSALYQGCQVPAEYDPMIAKLIVHAGTRTEAIARMRRALTEFVIGGIQTNIEFLLALSRSRAFSRGVYDTGFIDRHQGRLTEEPEEHTDD